MELTQEAFDALVHYTLRIELLNGKVLLYPVDAASKHYVSNRLHNYPDSFEEIIRPFPFLWFETVKQRHVIVATDSITRVAICSDLRVHSPKEVRYYDNFGLLGKEPVMEEMETGDGESEIIVFGDDPPQALIYHRGSPPEDGYGNNPLTFTELDEGCLGTLGLELDGECPLRPFMALRDDDGEENFVPTAQIIVMEFDDYLLYQAEDPDALMAEEEEIEDEEDEDDEDWEMEEETPDDEAEEENRKDNNDLPF